MTDLEKVYYYFMQMIVMLHTWGALNGGVEVAQWLHLVLGRKQNALVPSLTWLFPDSNIIYLIQFIIF